MGKKVAALKIRDPGLYRLMKNFLTVYLPLVFGSLSIIFAILSKGYGKKLLISAKIGLCTAIGCIGLIIVIMGTFITLFLSSSRSDMIRLGQQMDQQLEDQFGISPDEILGQSYEDIMEEREGSERLSDLPCSR